MSRGSANRDAGSPSGLVLADASDSYLSMAGAVVPPAVRLISILRTARAVAWFTVKVLFALVAVPLIVLFAVASVGGMFAHGSW